ncbi:MAG: hypothetical protein GYB65_18360 [Chloroflexi bacterium]|nr:hypothetical protein [Chloroflexota bacterium]
MTKRIEMADMTVPVIIQNVSGSLRIRGHEVADLLVDGDNPHVEQLGEGQPCLVRCDGDCRLTVPADAEISVQGVGSDAKLTDLNGKVDINAVGGDLTLRHTADVTIKAVGGDLRIKWADSVTVDAVGSDATIREVNGSARVTNVGSDLYLRNVEGDCTAEHIGSDLVLNVAFQEGQEYRFSAGGDILCRVHPETDARFVVPLGMTVKLDVPADVVEQEADGQQIITLGEGGATIYIQGGDELRLVGEAEDYVLNLGVQIEEEVETRLSQLEEKLSQHLEGLDEQIQAKAALFSSQAERLAERAQRQAQRASERVRRSMERRSSGSKRTGRVDIEWGGAPPPPKAKSEPVSEEERLMILRMVQENKISIEEAERLLAALDAQD